MAQKGLRYLPDISTLLRDAEPLRREIEGEPDPATRKRNERRRDRARDALIRSARQAEEAGTYLALSPDHREFYERLTEEAGGAPRQIGGRPIDEHYEILLAIAARLAVSGCEEAHDEEAGVVRALESVADRAGLSYERVRALHYRKDREWVTEVALSTFMLAEVRPCGGVWNLPDIKPEFPAAQPATLKRKRRKN